ncbi:MAG TPA: SNF2-related protein, partial [Beutenbergiaceae bacterium]|nr:SNF2-related protein [Beutenbergiaceae bacterium]
MLYEWQVADVDRLEESGFTGLLNIEPGGTKTILALAAHVRSGSEVTLVVAPKNTHGSAWIADGRDFFGLEPRVVGNGRKAEREAFDDFRWGEPGVYLMTPELLTRSDVSDWQMDMCIVDEGHKLNNAGKKGQRQLDLLAGRSSMRLFLSGTAWRNNFSRAWATMRFLWPELYLRGQVAHDNYWVWCRDRMTSEDVYTSRRDQFGRPKTVKRWLHEKEPGLLLSQAPCVITHKKRERCCEWHPNGFLPLEEPQVIEHVVPLSSAQKKIIRELEEQGLAWLEEDSIRVDLPITLQQR